jgi:hypothetical protein
MDAPVADHETTDRKPHICEYGSSGRCPCGFHREPERAIYVIPPLATDRERLSFEL